MTRKPTDDGDGPDDNGGGASGSGSGDAKPKGRTLVAFKPAAVFDIGQTDGDDLPEIATRLHGDDLAGAYGLLREVALLGDVETYSSP